MCNIRWGDIGLISIKKLPENLVETNTRIIEKGNNGHNHTIDNGKIYITKNSETLEENDFIFGYLDAKDTTLYHEDHGELVEGSSLRIAKIPDGFYELRKQKEESPEGLRPVID